MVWRRTLQLLCLAAGLARAAETDEFFESKVRPVLAQNCYACHTETRSGGLRLDSADAVQKGGKSGPPIVPGKPDESLLIQAIRQTHDAAQNAAGRQTERRRDCGYHRVGQVRRGLARGRA